MLYNRSENDPTKARLFTQWKRNESWIRALKRRRLAVFAADCISAIIFVPMLFEDNFDVLITTGVQSIAPMIGFLGILFTTMISAIAIDNLNDEIRNRTARQRRLATSMAKYENNKGDSANMVSPYAITCQFKKATYKRVL